MNTKRNMLAAGLTLAVLLLAAPLPAQQPDLAAAKQALADAQNAVQDAKNAADLAAAETQLRKALAALQQARTQIGLRPIRRPCCQEFKPAGCPPVKPCNQRDACLILKMPDVTSSYFVQPMYTRNGVHTFVNLYSAGVARGVENVTIRAMNASKVCSSCEPQQTDQEDCEPDQQPANPGQAP